MRASLSVSALLALVACHPEPQPTDDTDVDNTMRKSKFVRIGFRNKKSKKNWK